MEENKFRGNFQNAIGRKDEENLLSSIAHHWDSFLSGFLFQTMELPFMGNNPKYVRAFFDLYRSDHARFWAVNSKSIPNGLKAVFITDTGRKLITFL